MGRRPWIVVALAAVLAAMLVPGSAVSVVQHELEDTFVIDSGLDVKDKIVLEGVREVRDGDLVEYEYREPGEVLANQKFHAE